MLVGPVIFDVEDVGVAERTAVGVACVVGVVVGTVIAG